MLSVAYPLRPSLTNDLQLCENDRARYGDRALLFVDCTPGDRPMLPEFGSRLQPFSPYTESALHGELLKLGLNRWCASEDELVSYEVGARDRGDGIADYNVRVQTIG